MPIWRSGSFESARPLVRRTVPRPRHQCDTRSRGKAVRLVPLLQYAFRLGYRGGGCGFAPDKVTNLHNGYKAFDIYDPNHAMGDLSSTERSHRG